MPTVGGILYLALNLSLSSSDSTKHLNLPIILRSFKEKLMSSKRKIKARRKSMMKKNVWRETILSGFEETYRLEKRVLGQIFGICRRARK